jgi:hypothetical protein
MNNLLKTTEPSFAKDPRSGALINIDSASYLQYRNVREQYKQQQLLKEEVIGLKEEMSEIKQLLTKLVNGK